MRTYVLTLSAALIVALTNGALGQTKLPDGLRHVPVDALGFVHVRVGDFLQSELGKQLLQEVRQEREAGPALARIEKELGVGVADIESVTVLMLATPLPLQQRWDVQLRYAPVPPFGGPPVEKRFNLPAMPRPAIEAVPEPKGAGKTVRFSPVAFQEFLQPQPPLEQLLPYIEPNYNQPMPAAPWGDPLVIVTATKPYDRKKLLQRQLGESRHIHRAMVFLTDRSVMLGAAWDLARHSEMLARKSGPKNKPLESALALASKSHAITAGGHVPTDLRRAIFSPFASGAARELAGIAPLLQTDAGLAIDLGKQLDVTAQFQAATETSAESALQALKTLRVLAEVMLEKGNDAGESGGWKLVLEKRLKQALADVVIEQKELTVIATVKLEMDAVLVKRISKELIGGLRQKGDRARSVNNLKEIGLALHGYHDAHKRLPTAGMPALNNPNGKPLLSWRVHVLPFIDQAPLYQQFNLNEAWDHPDNKKLIAKMPPIYMIPGVDTKDGMTHYRVLVGQQTMFEPGQRITLVSVTDGSSNTIMAVEASEPTIWTQPDDLPFNPNGPLPKLGVHGDGFNALFGDATVRFIRATTPEQTVRAYITRNGGEAVNLPD